MGKLRICIGGATGWTGSALVGAIAKSSDFILVGAVAPRSAGQTIDGVKVSGSVAEALQTPTDVYIDYTSATSVYANVMTALEHNVAVVIGSSGLSAEQYASVNQFATDRKLGVIAAGNFSITAALAKRFSLLAAKYLPHREIVDYASATKIDMPSGTARELAEALGDVRPNELGRSLSELVGPPEARGAQVAGTPVHSLRLPGYTLAFEALFGLPDERLTIRHDAGTSAEPYVAGTLLAVRAVKNRVGLLRGLDSLLLD